MKVTLAIIAGILAGAIVALAGTVAVGLISSWWAEFIRGDKEPMVPTVFGGMLGMLLGGGCGLVFGVYTSVRVFGFLNRKAGTCVGSKNP